LLVRCPSCKYENSDSDATCNLCGALLVVKLPKRTATFDRTSLDDRIAAHRKTQRRQGLEEIRERITQKLERLTAIQNDSEIELLAHTRREEEALEEELQQAKEALQNNTEVLRETELHVRQLRRQVTALQFELRQTLQDKQAVLAEKQELGAEFERLQALQRALESGEQKQPGAVNPEAADLEIKGLQDVCVRLSERITILNLKLQERDSYLHWLLLEGDPSHWRERFEAIKEVDAEIAEKDESSELLHWLRASGGPEDAGTS
jgi:hypothetical protein